MILEVEHLSFAYRPERPLFYDVSFAFEQGQVLSILGANGAGKSTLLNCIANLLLPQQGDIRLHGTPLSRLELREISRIIGYVPQSHTPAYNYTVRDFVVMGRAPHLGTFQQPGRADYDLVDATLEEIVRRHVTPYGVVAREVADVQARSVYTVAAGTSQWKVLESFCRTYGGFAPRFAINGALLAAPERDNGRRLCIGDADPVLHCSWREDHYGVLTEALVIDKKRNVSYSVKNPDMIAKGGLMASLKAKEAAQ